MKTRSQRRFVILSAQRTGTRKQYAYRYIHRLVDIKQNVEHNDFIMYIYTQLPLTRGAPLTRRRLIRLIVSTDSFPLQDGTSSNSATQELLSTEQKAFIEQCNSKVEKSFWESQLPSTNNPAIVCWFFVSSLPRPYHHDQIICTTCFCFFRSRSHINCFTGNLSTWWEVRRYY